VFCGGWNVFASFVGLALSYAMFTVFAFGTFVTPLQQEFAWQRGPMSLALGISLAGFGVGATLIPALAQLLIDHRGWLTWCRC
jgi:hypothetical protein